MNNEHPITPPPELVQQWRDSWIPSRHGEFSFYIATQAARWGSDQELEACCDHFEDHLRDGIAKDLRVARRPKPPSLKKQALAELEILRGDANAHGLGFDAPAIRRALEALPE